MSHRRTTFTTAPAELDWSFSRELDPCVGQLDGLVVRVTDTGSLWPHQRELYQGHGFWAGDEDDWLALLRDGRARLRPWHEDDAFRAWLDCLGCSWDPATVELVYVGFQAGRLMSCRIV